MLRRYPKFLTLGLTFVAAFVLYRMGMFQKFETALNGGGILTFFLAGALWSFGFTSAFGLALLVAAAHENNPLLGALIGALGAVLVDMSIFSFVRFSFEEELKLIRGTRAFLYLHSILHRETVSERLRRYLLWSIAGFVIASPLPDELGVTLLSSLTEIKPKKFAVLCYLLNAAGILVILLLARAAQQQ